MAILAYDDVMLREPRLLVPNRQPIGPVRVDKTHPFGNGCRAFFCASRGPVNLVNGEMAITSAPFPLLSTQAGNRAFDVSAHRGYCTVTNVTVPFTVAIRVNLDSLPILGAVRRLCQLTKDAGLTTIAGVQIGNPGIARIIGQNYDGSNEQTAGLAASVGVWYDIFFLVTATALNVSANGVEDTAVAATWTAGPNRFSFFDADWGAGTEYLDGKVEWMGYWTGEEFWRQRVNGSPFRLSPYEMLIPA